VMFHGVTASRVVGQTSAIMTWSWALGLTTMFLMLVVDIMVFYTLFEMLLLGMFVYICCVSRAVRGMYASAMLAWYTLFGSSLLGVGCVILVGGSGTVSLACMPSAGTGLVGEHVMVFLVVCGWLSKLPAYPLHGWLYVAHVESCTEGSGVLAGIILKVGFLGLVRFVVLPLSGLFLYFVPFFLFVCCVGCLVTSFILICFVDLKSYVAGASVSHMHTCLLSILIVCVFCGVGLCLCVVLHSLSAALLFLVVGLFYEYGGSRCVLLTHVSGVLLFSWGCLMLVNIAFPSSLYVWGEWLILLGACHKHG